MADDGETDLKNAAPDRQDAVLEASWRALGRDLGGLGAFLGSKVRRSGSKGWRPRAGPTECARPVEDEVFEEEESAEVEGGSARHCHPDGGGGLKPAERGPGGSLRATYCTQLGPMQKANPFHTKC